MEINVYNEGLFVGIYTIFIYSLVQIFFKHKNIYLLLFIVGFCKHYSGYFLGLHHYYCKYGVACMKNKYRTEKTLVNSLFLESILEGFYFILVGSVLYMFFSEKQHIMFFGMLGFFIHVFSEMIGIHQFFCERCNTL
jgi:hypothetical protein